MGRRAKNRRRRGFFGSKGRRRFLFHFRLASDAGFGRERLGMRHRFPTRRWFGRWTTPASAAPATPARPAWGAAGTLRDFRIASGFLFKSHVQFKLP